MLVRWRGLKKAPLLAAGSGLMSGVEGEEEGLPFLAHSGGWHAGERIVLNQSSVNHD